MNTADLSWESMGISFHRSSFRASRIALPGTVGGYCRMFLGKLIGCWARCDTFDSNCLQLRGYAIFKLKSEELDANRRARQIEGPKLGTALACIHLGACSCDMRWFQFSSWTQPLRGEVTHVRQEHDEQNRPDAQIQEIPQASARRAHPSRAQLASLT